MEDNTATMHSNFLRALERLGSLTERSAIVRRSPWLLIDAGVDMEEFNLAVLTGPAADPVTSFAEARAWHAERGHLFRLLLREVPDRQIIEHAVQHGWHISTWEPSMLLDRLAEPPLSPDGLFIRTARSQKDIEAYGEVDAPAWRELSLGIARTVASFPDFTMLLGEFHGIPVATSMAVVTGDLVGVYNVQVQPEHRRKGFGRALTFAALDAGRGSGCTRASLQATAVGEPLYREMGFRAVYKYVELLPVH